LALVRGFAAVLAAVIEHWEYALFHGKSKSCLEALQVPRAMLSAMRTGLLYGTTVVLTLILGTLWTLAALREKNEPTNRMAACFVSSDPESGFSRTCMSSVVRSLLRSQSPEQILDLITSSRSTAQLRSNCHELGHIVGIETFRAYQSFEAALAVCPSTCSDSCQHGALGEALVTESNAAYGNIGHMPLPQLVSMASRLCSTALAPCHAVGHVIQLRTEDFRKSLDLCARVGGDYKTDCYNGVYMETIGGKLSMQFGTSTLAFPSDDPLYPCDDIASPYRRSCYKFLSAILRSRFSLSAQEAADRTKSLCATLSGHDRSLCFERYGNHGGISDGTPELYDNIKNNCASLLNADDRLACSQGIVFRLRYYKRAAELESYCSSLPADIRNIACVPENVTFKS
jgi:hypothetical protein